MASRHSSMNAAANSCSEHCPVSKSATAGEVTHLRRKSSGVHGRGQHARQLLQAGASTSTPPRSNSNTLGIAIPASPRRIVCQTRPLAHPRRGPEQQPMALRAHVHNLDWLLQGVLVDRPPPTLTPLRYDSNPAQSSVRGTSRVALEPVVLNSEDAPGHVGSGSSARSVRTLHSGLSPDLGAAGGRRAHVSRLARLARRPAACPSASSRPRSPPSTPSRDCALPTRRWPRSTMCSTPSVEMQKDLGRLKETVGQRDAQDKEAQSRLAALEERVSTLATPPVVRDHGAVRRSRSRRTRPRRPPRREPPSNAPPRASSPSSRSRNRNRRRRPAAPCRASQARDGQHPRRTSRHHVRRARGDAGAAEPTPSSSAPDRRSMPCA